MFTKINQHIWAHLDIFFGYLQNKLKNKFLFVVPWPLHYSVSCKSNNVYNMSQR